MKATGIVRQLDDLGRIVIPKEVRRTIGLKEGDQMEFWVEDGKLVLTPYHVPDSRQILNQLIESVETGDEVTCYLLNELKKRL